MTTIAVNVRLFLAILCSLALICTFLLIATDTTDEKRDFVHYVMYILVFLLEIGMEVTIMLFVGGSMKSYTELCTLPTYEERLEYLQLHGEVGRDTFGFDRWLNQDFYQSREWRQFRDRIIARDMGCDLGCPDHPITDWVLRDADR